MISTAAALVIRGVKAGLDIPSVSRAIQDLIFLCREAAGVVASKSEMGNSTLREDSGVGRR